MKQNKTYICLLIGALIISLVSCGTARKQNANVDASSGSIDEDKAEDTNSAESYVYGFNTYSDCWKALADGDATDYKTLRSESSQYGALYEAMLSKFASENALLYIPTSHGKELSFQNREGFSNISLLTNELYGMPWIWYHCVHNDTKISVRVTYPSILNNEEVAAAKTAWEMLKVIAPNAPLPDNYQSYESYRNVYEQALSIDGETVSALVQECTDDSVYVSFLLKDIYVMVCTQGSSLSDEFWNEFSMVVYTAE